MVSRAHQPPSFCAGLLWVLGVLRSWLTLPVYSGGRLAPKQASVTRLVLHLSGVPLGLAESLCLSAEHSQVMVGNPQAGR